MAIEPLVLPTRIDTDRLNTLKDLYPEVFADGRVNLDELKVALLDLVEDDDAATEHYGLSWPGKKAAKRLAVKPPVGTLAPIQGQGVDEETTKNIFIEGEN